MAAENITSIVEAIEKLSLLELKELVTEIETKFGVSGAIMVGAAPAAGGEAAPAAGKSGKTANGKDTVSFAKDSAVINALIGRDQIVHHIKPAVTVFTHNFKNLR